MNKNREITKLTPEQEFAYVLFREPEHVRKIIQSMMTGYTRWYFEAKSDEERWIVKGGSLAMKALLDAHLTASEINQKYTDDQIEQKLKDWVRTYKIKKT